MITTLLIASVSAYVLLLLLLLRGLNKSCVTDRSMKDIPLVSVIVAARNEEQFIEKCLASLVELDYPKARLEIIVVNDGSADKTPALIESFAEKHPGIKMISTSPQKGNLRGKTNAVAEGIKASSGEILMFTDADCTVPAGWIRQTVGYFDEQTGVVGGFTLLNSGSIFEGIQALDWIFLFEIAAATAGLNIPLTVIGNNLSLRRKAYDLTGGYIQIPFSVTEDYALVEAILQKTGYRVRFPVDPGTLIRSQACKSWKQLYRQKQRWGVGGLDMVFRGYIIMAVGWTARLLILISLWHTAFTLWLIIFTLTCATEIAFLWKPLKCLKAVSYIKYYPVFALYMSVYVLMLPFIAFLSKNVLWKERNL